MKWFGAVFGPPCAKRIASRTRRAASARRGPQCGKKCQAQRWSQAWLQHAARVNNLFPSLHVANTGFTALITPLKLRITAINVYQATRDVQQQQVYELQVSEALSGILTNHVKCLLLFRYLSGSITM